MDEFLKEFMGKIYNDTLDGVCELIDKHIQLNHNCMLEYLDEDNSDMANAHSGAVTGLLMLKMEIMESYYECED